MDYQTIRMRWQGTVCFLQIHRPEANNTINDLLVAECHHALDACEERAQVVVLEGLPDVFCWGADFQGIHAGMAAGELQSDGPEPLYDLWLRLATGPFVSVAHVRGKVNAGGVGFVAACDLVLSDRTAQFSLSELLFGLFPACVLPFLVRRIGWQKANVLTLTTTPIGIEQALSYGLVDACEESSEALLRKHLLRLRRLNKTAVQRYKQYRNSLDDSLAQSKKRALAANEEIFADPVNLQGIYRYIESGLFPWEGENDA